MFRSVMNGENEGERVFSHSNNAKPTAAFLHEDSHGFQCLNQFSRSLE